MLPESHILRDKVAETVLLLLVKWYVKTEQQPMPFGYHTLGIKYKGVLPTMVNSMLVGNQGGEGLTRSAINSFAPIYISWW